MAQLTDDCFAFSGSLLPIAEMERLIEAGVGPVAEIEDVSLSAALGRVLARDLVADLDLPPFDNSAVDGFAVRHGDLAHEGETRLAIVDRVAAGAAAARALGRGEAVRIFTGAPMPAGADTVFMQEDVRVEGGAVIVPPGLKFGANRRLAGEDVRRGAVTLPAGRRLAARDVALAAAVGVAALPVRRRVRVAVFSTGDEVVEPGAPRGPNAIYDANRYLLSGLLTKFGAEVADLGIVADDPAALRKTLAQAAVGRDLVLSSGGVSTGEADHMRTVLEEVGRLVFWRVAIKPGRPVAMGTLPGGAAGKGAARIRARRVARGRRRRGRSGEIRAGRGGGDHLAHRDRRPRRAVRRRHDGRAGLDRRVPSLCGARGLTSASCPPLGRASTSRKTWMAGT